MKNNNFKKFNSAWSISILIAILTLMASIAYAQGAGKALDFDGSNDHLDCGNDGSLDITNAITIEAWIKGSGIDFSAEIRTISSPSKYHPQFQVVGDKIYYVWMQGNTQIWTAEKNTDGTGWSATLRRNSSRNIDNPQLQVVGSEIFYVWQERDASNYWQLWSGKINTNGTSWSAVQRTNSSTNKFNPQIQVVADSIHFGWHALGEAGGNGDLYTQIWTATINLAGDVGYMSQRTLTLHNKEMSQFQIVDDTIYGIWQEWDGSYWQIWTGKTDYSSTKRTTSSYDKNNPQLQVVGDKIYYVWQEKDASRWQIRAAEMNTNETGWSLKHKTTSVYNKYTPQLQVVGGTIHYVWKQGSDEIWTAVMNIVGTDWSETQRRNNTYLDDPQLQVVGCKTYYTWREYNSSYYQIYTGEMDSNLLNKGDFYGIGICGNTVNGFIDAGIDGFKYEADDISNTAGAVVSSTIDTDWNHIAITYDKSFLKLYVNGIEKNTDSYSENIYINPFDLIIGDDFDGRIDEVRVWDIARTELQIRADMNQKIAASSNLKGYWRFDDGSDPTDDYSSNNNTGDLKNGPTWITPSIAAIGDKSHIGIDNNNLPESLDVPIYIDWDSGPGNGSIFAAIQTNEAPYINTGLLAYSPSTYWELWIADNGNFQADVKFHYDNLPNDFGYESELKLYTRSSAADSWIEVSNYTVVSNDDGSSTDTDGIGYITTNLTNFSQFIITKDADDVGVSEINYPTNGSTIDYDPITVQCTVKNFGTDNQTNVTVWCKIDNDGGDFSSPIYSASTTVNVNKGSTALASFAPQFDPPDVDQALDMICYTVLSGDGNTSNDTYAIDFEVLAAYEVSISAIVNHAPNSGVEPGTENVLMLEFALSTDENSAVWESIQIDNRVEDDYHHQELSYDDLSLVKIYKETNKISGFQFTGSPIDTFLGSSDITGSDGGSGTVPVNQTITTTPDTFYIVYDISASAIPNHYVGVLLGDYTYFKITSPDYMSSANFPVQSEEQVIEDPSDLTYSHKAVDGIMTDWFDNTELIDIQNGDSLYLSWDDRELFLRCTEADWETKGEMFIYFDTKMGKGSNTSYDWNGTHTFPEGFLADYAVIIGFDPFCYILRPYQAPDWQEGICYEDVVFQGNNTEIGILFEYFEYEPLTPLKYLVFAQEENNSNVWNSFPPGYQAKGSFTRYYNYNGLPEGVAPNEEDGPLSVMLSTFTAFYLEENPILQWITQNETDNLGWNVYRSDSEYFEEAVQINKNLIPGAGTSNIPTEYVFIDEYSVTTGTTYRYWIESKDVAGCTETYGPISLNIPDDEKPTTSLETNNIFNYPNPFHPYTEINFMMEEAGDVEVSIYNIKGQKIITAYKRYVSENEIGEWLTIPWNGRDENNREVTSGIYTYIIKTDKNVYRKKMLLLK